MDELDQAVLSSCYPVAEVIAHLHLTSDGYWRLHLRKRHESWSWHEATVEAYEGLTLLETMDVLADMEYRRDHPGGTPGAGCSR